MSTYSKPLPSFQKENYHDLAKVQFEYFIEIFVPFCLVMIFSGAMGENFILSLSAVGIVGLLLGLLVTIPPFFAKPTQSDYMEDNDAQFRTLVCPLCILIIVGMGAGLSFYDLENTPGPIPGILGIGVFAAIMAIALGSLYCTRACFIQPIWQLQQLMLDEGIECVSIANWGGWGKTTREAMEKSARYGGLMPCFRFDYEHLSLINESRLFPEGLPPREKFGIRGQKKLYSVIINRLGSQIEQVETPKFCPVCGSLGVDGTVDIENEQGNDSFDAFPYKMKVHACARHLAGEKSARGAKAVPSFFIALFVGGITSGANPWIGGGIMIFFFTHMLYFIFSRDPVRSAVRVESYPIFTIIHTRNKKWMKEFIKINDEIARRCKITPKDAVNRKRLGSLGCVLVPSTIIILPFLFVLNSPQTNRFSVIFPIVAIWVLITICLILAGFLLLNRLPRWIYDAKLHTFEKCWQKYFTTLDEEVENTNDKEQESGTKN